MSRAFVREDVDPPERSGRTRSPSGLPPGAVNYITERGAKRLRQELANLRQKGSSAQQIEQLEQILRSATIVEPPESSSDSVRFGSTVTVEAADGTQTTFTIVGLDEIGFEPDGVSWISPIGKALLAAEVGDRVTAGEQKLGKIVSLDYRR